MFELDRGSSKSNFYHTKGFLPARDFYWGLALSAKYKNDWSASISIGETYIGGGLTGPHLSNTTASHIFTNALMIEKNVFTTNSINILNQKAQLGFHAIGGLGLYWIPNFDTVSDFFQGILLGGVYMERKISTVNRITGNANIGFSTHVMVNKKTRFKISLLYTYAMQVSSKFEYKLIYPFIDNREEQFSTLSGRHRFSIYGEIPINLYRNKAQKKYYNF